MNYQVIITPSAKADIFETNTWLLENYPHVAEKWLWGTSQKITSLLNLSERCPRSSESEAFDVVIRHLIYGKKPHTYRILFSIQEEKVYVLRVRSTKQKSILDK